MVTGERMQPDILFERDFAEEGVSFDALLFEAGEYPDKSLTVTEADLDQIISRFTAEVPLKDDHQDGAFDGKMGWLKSVWRKGKQLFGKLVLDPDFARFLRKHGIRKLSVGLNRAPLRLAEVSLTLAPRVEAAGLLYHQNHNPEKGDVMDPKEIEALKARVEEAEAKLKQAREMEARFQEAEAGRQAREQEIERLRFDARKREVQEIVRQLRDEKKRVIPAQAGLLEAILLEMPPGAEITFHQASMPLQEALVAFCEAGPDMSALFSEQARADPSQETPVVTGAQQEINRVFGVTDEVFLKHQNR